MGFEMGGIIDVWVFPVVTGVVLYLCMLLSASLWIVLVFCIIATWARSFSISDFSFHHVSDLSRACVGGACVRVLGDFVVLWSSGSLSLQLCLIGYILGVVILFCCCFVLLRGGGVVQYPPRL